MQVFTVSNDNIEIFFELIPRGIYENVNLSGYFTIGVCSDDLEPLGLLQFILDESEGGHFVSWITHIFIDIDEDGDKPTELVRAYDVLYEMLDEYSNILYKSGVSVSRMCIPAVNPEYVEVRDYYPENEIYRQWPFYIKSALANYGYQFNKGIELMYKMLISAIYNLALEKKPKGVSDVKSIGKISKKEYRKLIQELCTKIQFDNLPVDIWLRQNVWDKDLSCCFYRSNNSMGILLVRLYSFDVYEAKLVLQGNNQDLYSMLYVFVDIADKLRHKGKYLLIYSCQKETEKMLLGLSNDIQQIEVLHGGLEIEQ